MPKPPPPNKTLSEIEKLERTFNRLQAAERRIWSSQICTLIFAAVVVDRQLRHAHDRAINPRLNSRLGCQCVLQPGGGEVMVTLPDQSQFLGE